MSAKTTRKPWRSGFCNPTNPADSHGRCDEHPHRLGWQCSCDCHDAIGAEIVGCVPVGPSGILVTDAEPESDEWFAARREGITGTDLPKILGLSKYGNALGVWMDKRGELDDEAGEEARWGNLLEDVVAQEWADRNSVQVERVGVAANLGHPWIRASLDRLIPNCPDGERSCALEVKTRSAFVARDWRDGVPDDVLAQVQWGLLTTGLTHMHIAALIGGQRLASFRLDADETIQQYLLDAARPVWQSVLNGAPPDVHPDAEGVLLDLLDRVYRRRAGDREIDAEKAAVWIEQYRDGNEIERTARALKTAAKTALVQMIDDGDAGLIDGAPVFTYRAPDPTDTLSAANLRALRDASPEVYEALKSDGYITTTKPSPRFTLKEIR